MAEAERAVVSVSDHRKLSAWRVLNQAFVGSLWLGRGSTLQGAGTKAGARLPLQSKILRGFCDVYQNNARVAPCMCSVHIHHYPHHYSYHQYFKSPVLGSS